MTTTPVTDVRTPIESQGGDPMQAFGELWKKQEAQGREKLGSALKQVDYPGEALTDLPIWWVDKEKIVDVLKFLQTTDGLDYQFLSDLTATDETPRKPRFDVVYHLFSHTTSARIRVKTQVGEKEKIPTIVSVWPSANWAEREVFDMFGVRFEGHPDLRRILMDARWEGHPLRKDYPLKGYQIFPTPEPIDPELLK